MSTHAAIVQKVENGYRGIYCHSDGDLSHVGRILANFYHTPDRVKDLIDLGDLSSLGETLASPGEHYSRLATTAYMRDRGETDCEAYTAKTLPAVKRYIDHSFFYVFENGKWTVNGEDLNERLEKAGIQ